MFAVEVGGRTRLNTNKFSRETKCLIKKRQNMQGPNTIDKMELPELSKLIDRSKVNDITITQKHNVETIEHSIINGGRLIAVKKKLGIRENEIYGL